MSIFDKYLVNNFLHTEDSGEALPTAIYEEDFSVDLGDFTTSGDLPWTRVTDDGNGDLFSARSGAISDNQLSILQLVKNTVQESTLLQYDYKTSTEQNFDFLHVKVNGQIVAVHSGTNAWTTNRVWIHGIGSQTIQFIYYRDPSDGAGTNQVWIDNVGLYSYEESAVSNTSTLFKQDLTTIGNFVSKGYANFNGIITNGDLEGFNSNGYRLWRHTIRPTGTVINQFTPGQPTWVTESAALAAEGYYLIKNPVDNVVKIKVGVSYSGDLENGYIQTHANGYVRIGEAAGADLTKILTVNGDSLFKGDVDVTGVGTFGYLGLSGTNPAILGNDLDGVFNIASDNTILTGSGIQLYGGSHATNANDINFVSDGSTVGNWDFSTGAWNFNGLKVNTSAKSVPAAFYSEDFATDLGDFTTSGDAVWTRVTDEGNGDLFSARSGNISHKQISVLQLVKTTTQESTLLRYDYKTSTEGDYDFLLVMVDGVIVKRYSGTNAWTTDEVFIHGIGSKTIKFVYWKDNSSDGGTDQVWIDNVSLHNYEESAIFDTSTVVRNDFTVDGDFAVTNGATHLGETSITGRTNFYNTNGYRTMRLNVGGGGGNFTIWNENAVQGIILESANTYSNFRLYNPTTGAENVGFSGGVGSYPGGFMQLPVSTVKVRIGEFVGSDPTKMLVVNGHSLFRGVTSTGVYTVATLPTGAKGDRAFVSDANAATFNTVAAGGGANNVPVFHDGTNWKIG